jgi:hypothetical protein
MCSWCDYFVCAGKKKWVCGKVRSFWHRWKFNTVLFCSRASCVEKKEKQKMLPNLRQDCSMRYIKYLSHPWRDVQYHHFYHQFFSYCLIVSILSEDSFFPRWLIYYGIQVQLTLFFVVSLFSPLPFFQLLLKAAAVASFLRLNFQQLAQHSRNCETDYYFPSF